MSDSSNLPYVDTNPSGIGNLMYGDAINPLDEQDKNNKANTEAVNFTIKQKRQKIKDSEDFMKGLSLFKTDGVISADIPGLQNDIKNYLDLGTKAVAAGGDINNPQNPHYWDLMQGRNAILTKISASKDQNKWIQESVKPLGTKPDDFDHEKTMGKVGNFVVSGDPLKRAAAYGSNPDLLVTKAPDFIKSLFLEADKIKPTKETNGEVKLPSGAYTMEQSTEVDPKVAEAVGRAKFVENPKAAQEAFQNLPPDEQVPYKLAAALRTANSQAQGIDSQGIPAEEYAADLAKRRVGGKHITYQGHSFPPGIVEGMKERFAGEQSATSDKDYQLLYRQLAGDPDAFDMEQAQGGLTANPVSGQVTIPAPMQGFVSPVNQTRMSLANSGDYIGAFLARKPLVANGEIVKDGSGNIVYDTPKPEKNIHYAVKLVDGKPMVMNSESLYNYGLKKDVNINESNWNEYYNDPAAWQPMTAGYVKKFEAGESPKERMNNAATHKKYLEGRNAVEQGSVNVQKASGYNPKSKEPTYSIKGKTYSLKQLTDLGYTEEQVAQYKAK